MTDIIIIGGGPAGVSAALTAKNRGKNVKIISNDPEQSNLWKAKSVENYPGLPNVSGKDILTVFRKQIEDAGIETVTGRALNAISMGDGFSVSVGQDYYGCKAIILTTGIVQQSTYPGEQEFLGRGVSYCATCDGMLFRGKKIAVIGLNEEAESEAEFLRSIGCAVEYFDKTRAKKYEIKGEETVAALVADGEVYPVDGVFILRSTIAPGSFLSGLETENGHIVTDSSMKTTVDGVFAAGDCTGRPYQVARAVGQGNTAALSASEYLDKK
ncbi:MAG: FAD-dependent oxidoreductase [Oscillospiraceae bacterium]|nr:FAD-dependent oxidoreductase [Oscillospiraceae bacterium]